jgi:hypothetical protein
MRRVLIVAGIVVSLAGVVATGAAAAQPEFYECAKVKGGRYESGCLKEGGSGGFELVPGTGKNQKLSGLGNTHAEWSVPGSGGIECKGTEKTTGEIATPTTLAHVVLTFKECTFAGRTCRTGEAGVEMATRSLKGELGYVSESSHLAGVDLSGEASSTILEVPCEGLETKVTGSVIGKIGPVNTMTKARDIEFSLEGSGFQEITAFEGGPTDVLEYEVNHSGPFEGGLLLTTETTTNKKLELKA